MQILQSQKAQRFQNKNLHYKCKSRYVSSKPKSGARGFFIYYFGLVPKYFFLGMPAVLPTGYITDLNKFMSLKTFKILNSIFDLAFKNKRLCHTTVNIQVCINGLTWILEEISLW